MTQSSSESHTIQREGRGEPITQGHYSVLNTEIWTHRCPKHHVRLRASLLVPLLICYFRRQTATLLCIRLWLGLSVRGVIHKQPYKDILKIKLYLWCSGCSFRVRTLRTVPHCCAVRVAENSVVPPKVLLSPAQRECCCSQGRGPRTPNTEYSEDL